MGPPSPKGEGLGKVCARPLSFRRGTGLANRAVGWPGQGEANGVGAQCLDRRWLLSLRRGTGLASRAVGWPGQGEADVGGAKVSYAATQAREFPTP
jgi:hypothetical protein